MMVMLSVPSFLKSDKCYSIALAKLLGMFAVTIYVECAKRKAFPKEQLAALAGVVFYALIRL
jgi:hypothetical protein